MDESKPISPKALAEARTALARVEGVLIAHPALAVGNVALVVQEDLDAIALALDKLEQLLDGMADSAAPWPA